MMPTLTGAGWACRAPEKGNSVSFLVYLLLLSLFEVETVPLLAICPHYAGPMPQDDDRIFTDVLLCEISGRLASH
jgi:hypothetical protein